ncbi:MAG: hypothetical protein AAGA18_07070 [Verrucomicrobiota bacterium]
MGASDGGAGIEDEPIGRVTFIDALSTRSLFGAPAGGAEEAPVRGGKLIRMVSFFMFAAFEALSKATVFLEISGNGTLGFCWESPPGCLPNGCVGGCFFSGISAIHHNNNLVSFKSQ